MKELCDALNFRFKCRGDSYHFHTVIKNGIEIEKVLLCPVHQAYFTNFHRGKFYAFLKVKYGKGEYVEPPKKLALFPQQKTNVL